ncbi:hypothetical protein ACQPUZ_07130 [Clostridium tertium]
MTICRYSVIPAIWIMTSYSTCYGLALINLSYINTVENMYDLVSEKYKDITN